LALERPTTSLFPPNTAEPNGTISYGVGNINSTHSGEAWVLSGTFGYSINSLGSFATFNGSPLANIGTAGRLLDQLGLTLQGYVGNPNSSLGQSRSFKLSKALPLFNSLFNCIEDAP
jgi:hypothetical protein